MGHPFRLIDRDDGRKSALQPSVLNSRQVMPQPNLGSRRV